MELANTFCNGCGACVNICNKNAITMQENTEGFVYPKVNSDLCVNCGLCTSVCPVNFADRLLKNPLRSYAAWIKDSSIRHQSSSGGLFYSVAEKVIDMGGVVYGAAWDNELQLRHIGVDRKEDISLLMGSKYLQSNIGNSYSEIRNHLREEKWVCFCGTPCQVAGLKLFLRKDYDRLITIDFVCHGVPSQKIFDVFVSDIETRKKIKIDRYYFRSCLNFSGKFC